MPKYVVHNKLLYACIITFLFIITGCSTTVDDKENIAVHVTENPDAEEVLTADPEADIFQFDGIIYQTDIDWVEELTLTKDKKVGEIKKKNETGKDFENEMSNKLPVGAKIYSVKEDEAEVGGPILLVESDGRTFNYYGLVEG